MNVHGHPWNFMVKSMDFHDSLWKMLHFNNMEVHWLPCESIIGHQWQWAIRVGSIKLTRLSMTTFVGNVNLGKIKFWQLAEWWPRQLSLLQHVQGGHISRFRGAIKNKMETVILNFGRAYHYAISGKRTKKSSHSGLGTYFIQWSVIWQAHGLFVVTKTTPSTLWSTELCLKSWHILLVNVSFECGEVNRNILIYFIYTLLH